MNASPKRDVEGVKIRIACMAMQAIQNTLDKNQKNGDATKVTASGSIEPVSMEMPTIDTRFETFSVDKNGIRTFSDGTKLQTKFEKDEVDMYEKRLAEENEKQEER